MNRLLIGSADKTNLLLQLLQNETAVTVIDPTGELARAAANQLPPALTQRALYFDPADMARPIGLNVLQNVPADDRHRVTEQLCAYFEAIGRAAGAHSRTTFWPTACACFWTTTKHCSARSNF